MDVSVVVRVVSGGEERRDERVSRERGRGYLYHEMGTSVAALV